MEYFKIECTDYNYITKCGRVFSNSRGKMQELVQRVQWKYLAVGVSVNGKYTKRHVHRLLALTFIPNPENKEEVNHKDGNKLNNSLDNLEWVTKKENARHAQRTGLTPIPSGEKNGRSVLTEEQVIDIYENLLKGAPNIEMCNKYNVTPSTVLSIKKRINWTYLLKEYPPIPLLKRGIAVRNDKVRDVCKLLQQGGDVSTISEVVGVSDEMVRDIQSRRSFEHISKDFEW